MLIAQIAYTGFGGLGSVVFSLIAADVPRSRDWAVGFIGDQVLESTYATRCTQQNVRYAAFQTERGKPYSAWMRLARWLGQTRPDVVICHSITAILPCRWYAWWHGACLVAVEHTPNEVKTAREWAGSRLAMLLADRVVLLTSEYQQQLKAAHGVLFRPKKVSVIPNGIDTDFFSPRRDRTRSPAGAIVLGMAARFSFSKRQDVLVEVLERLRELRPGTDFRLSLAGDGPELERVKERAARGAAADAIRFEGLLSEDAVASWLRGLDVYVHVTEGETLSTALLQAMATGLPIVASDIPGVRNLLAGQVDCGVCVANVVEEFAAAILQHVDEPEEARQRGARARARAVEHHSHAAMLERYLAITSECGLRSA